VDAGDPWPLAEMLGRAVKDSLDRFLLPNLAGPVKLLPLSALTRPDLELRTLRAAADRGRLRAMKDEAGRWMSTRQWVDDSRKKRRVGRPRKDAAAGQVGLCEPAAVTTRRDAAPSVVRQRQVEEFKGPIKRALQAHLVALRFRPDGPTNVAADVPELLVEREGVPASGGEIGVERLLCHAASPARCSAVTDSRITSMSSGGIPTPPRPV
jgi:hypothetical protein